MVGINKVGGKSLILTLFFAFLSSWTQYALAGGDSKCEDFLTANPKELVKPKTSFVHNSKYVLEIAGTPIKDQCGYGGCWIYSTVTGMERKILQTRGAVIDLSEQYVIAMSLQLRAVEALLIPGLSVHEGGWFESADWLIAKHGIVPTSAWKPRIDFENPKHSSRLNYYLNARIAKFQMESQQPGVTYDERADLYAQAKEDILVIFETYFGKMPTKFEFDGKQYSPTSFAKEFIPAEERPLLKLTFEHPGLPPALEERARAINPSGYLPSDVNRKSTHYVGKAKAEEIEQYIVQQLRTGEPVPLAFEVVRPFIQTETGIMSIEAFETPPGFEPPAPAYRYPFDLNKGGHLVEIIGVDVNPQTGQVIKFKIKNSWGKKAGEQGYYHMYRDYFEAYMMNVYLRLPKGWKPAK